MKALRIFLILVLCELLVFLPVSGDAQQLQKRAEAPTPLTNCKDLPCYVKLPYLTLFELASQLDDRKSVV